jgi:hypothetical protein
MDNRESMDLMRLKSNSVSGAIAESVEVRTCREKTEKDSEKETHDQSTTEAVTSFICQSISSNATRDYHHSKLASAVSI